MDVKNTPIDKIDRSGAAFATDTGSLNNKDNIGPDNTAMPSAQGIEMMEANLRQEYMIFMERALFAILSSSVVAFLIAAKEAVKVGVKEDAIG